MKLHDQTLRLLRVSAGADSSNISCKIEIDEYVPLQFSTYEGPLGAGFVRLGNYATTLLELAFQPQTQVLRGVTITSLEKLSLWPDFELATTLEKLPIVATTFQAYEVVDLQDDFKVAVRPKEIIAFWMHLEDCDIYKCGSASFLTVDGVLAGVWFTDLTIPETNLFMSHANRS